MKNCTKQLLLFKGISKKKIEVDSNGGEVSSNDWRSGTCG